MSPAFTAAPRWVSVVERLRHIFTMNQAELTQITLLIALGFWWMLPGATWALSPYADLMQWGLSEESFAFGMMVIGGIHIRALWLRLYRVRSICAAIEAAFWFTLSVAVLHSAPVSSMAPITFVLSLSVATTYWRLGARL